LLRRFSRQPTHSAVGSHSEPRPSGSVYNSRRLQDATGLPLRFLTVAASMRRLVGVKRIVFGSCEPEYWGPDQREAQALQAFSFQGKGFVFWSVNDTVDPRPTGGRNPCIPPTVSHADSPCFHPHSWWSGLLRCKLGSSISTGAAISGIELNPRCRRLVSPRPRSHPNSALWVSATRLDPPNSISQSW